MSTRDAILVLGCDDEAVNALDAALRTRGVEVVIARSLAALLLEAASRKPVAIILGVRPETADDLQAIGALHAMRARVAVIVIGGADSLELERKARAENIFYYLVEPIQIDELEAVVDDAIRYGGHD